MNRYLRWLFGGLAAVNTMFALLLAWDLHDFGLAWYESKTVWVLAGAAAIFGWVARRFSFAARIRVFMILLAFLFVEILLQVICSIGWMKAVNTKDPLPWCRVYWTSEGLGNSIRNRYAWHFPEFALERTNRVALIGDSFVEAVEVRRAGTMGALLRDHLHHADANTTAMSFGEHGMGPAQYLELLKYAQRHFAIQSATLVIYLGNDISDCSPRLQFHDPKQYLYYTLAADGSVALDATGERTRATYERGLEERHRPVWRLLPRLASSHCLSLQVPLSIWHTRQLRQRIAQDAGHQLGPETQLARLGLKGAPFAIKPTPEALEGMSIVQGILDRAAALAREKGIRLSIVTVPFFPPDFYAQPGPAWTAQLGEYDFFRPDRELQDWATRRGLPFLSLGQTMRARSLTPAEIRRLYLSNGCGHFSEAGHRFAADAIHEAFYSAPK